MTATLRNRFMVVFTVIGLALSVFAVPAEAKPLKGTASLATPGTELARTVLAGTAQQKFDFTVSNPLNSGTTLGTAVNYVEILPPPDAGLIVPTAYTGPTAGWTGRRTGSGKIIFEGGTLAAGSSGVFSITADVGRPATDQSRTWGVGASDDAGQTVQQFTAASAGALSTGFRVLKVIDVSIIGTPEVTDKSVTVGQAFTVRTTVQNAGSGSPSVTALLGAPGISSTAPPAQIIPASATRTFDFTVSFAAPATVNFSADATAAGIDALDGALNGVIVQAAAAFTAAINTLSPKVVVPGFPYTFQLNLRNAGGVTATIDKAASRLQFASGSFSAPLESPSSYNAGQTATAAFASTLVPLSIPDNTYTPTLSVKSTDSNGFTNTVPVTIVDTIKLDRLVPAVLPVLTPPAPAVKGEAGALSNGVTFTMGGTVTDSGTPCGLCTIQSAILKQFDAAGADLNKNIDVKANLSNSNGTLSGSTSKSFDAAARSAQLVVVVADEASQLSPAGQSLQVPVDNIAPAPLLGWTGGLTKQDTRRIDVVLSERAFFPRGAQTTDWAIDGNIVTAVAIQDCGPSSVPTKPTHQTIDCVANTNDQTGGNGFAIGNRIVLTIAQANTQDQEPTVTYQGNDLSRARDRVNLGLLNQAVTAVDGIIPALPIISTVDGKPLQDQQFFTNKSAPRFSLTSVQSQHKIQVWRDLNTDGKIDESGASPDDLLGEAVVPMNATTVTIDSKSLGAVDIPEMRLLTKAIDLKLNTTPEPGAIQTSSILNLDFTAPRVGSPAVSLSAATATVSFSEPMYVGRNFASDWVLSGTVNGNPQSFIISTVGGSGGVRTLTIEDDSFRTNDPTVVVNRVFYSFAGSNTADRYQDRAGNPLVDFTAAF